MLFRFLAFYFFMGGWKGGGGGGGGIWRTRILFLHLRGLVSARFKFRHYAVFFNWSSMAWAVESGEMFLATPLACASAETNCQTQAIVTRLLCDTIVMYSKDVVQQKLSTTVQNSVSQLVSLSR